MAQYRIHFVFIDPSPTGHHSWVHPLFWYCFNHLGYRIITMMWRFCVQGSVFLPVCHLDILRGNAWQSLDVSRWNKTSSSSTRIFFFPLINRKDKFKRMIMHSFSECLWYFFFWFVLLNMGQPAPLLLTTTSAVNPPLSCECSIHSNTYSFSPSSLSLMKSGLATDSSYFIKTLLRTNK